MDAMRARAYAAAGTVLALVTLAATVAGTPASAGTGAGARCRPPTTYVTTELADIVGPDNTFEDMNDKGWVVGERVLGGVYTAYLWRRGDTIRLTPPDARFGEVVGVNERGEVLHSWIDAAGQGQAAIWRDGRTIPVEGGGDQGVYQLNERGEVLLATGVWRRGTVTPVVAPPGSDHTLIPLFLGDRGQVAGPQLPVVPPGGGHPGPDRAFLWRRGEVTDVTGPFTFRDVVDLDRAGRILLRAAGPQGGWSTVLWDDGDSVDLGSLGGTTLGTYGLDLNDRRQVVGLAETAAGEEHAFLWDGGRLVDLHPEAGTRSTAYHVNERGEAVGLLSSATVNGQPVVWSCGAEVPIPLPGYDNGSAFPVDINDRGQVLVTFDTATGRRGFVATPTRS